VIPVALNGCTERGAMFIEPWSVR